VAHCGPPVAPPPTNERTSDDAIAAADIGWQVIADFTTDVDTGFGPGGVKLYNVMLPEVVDEEDVLDTYPFRVQSVTGGIPVPPTSRPRLDQQSSF
jgi:hypothetical protein